MFFSLYVLVFYRFQINEIYVRMYGNFLPYIMKISSVSNKIFFRIYFRLLPYIFCVIKKLPMFFQKTSATF